MPPAGTSRSSVAAGSTRPPPARYVRSMNARLFVLPLLAAGVAFAAWQFGGLGRGPAANGPAATWRVGGDVDFTQARNWDELPAESRLRLSWNAPEPMHVYVFGRSGTDGTLLLWPAAELKSDLPQPLPAGPSVLPGKRADKELAWSTRSLVLPSTTYVVVAAKEPVPELEALLPKLRRWSTSVLPDGSMQVTKPGITGGDPVDGAPGSGWPAPLLQQIADLFTTETIVNGPLRALPGRSGVFGSSWSAKEKPGTAKIGEPGKPVLPEGLKALQEGLPAPTPEKR